jgi:hypothetical protein
MVGIGYALYVALDAEGEHPQQAPPLLSESEADHRRDQSAAARQAIRLARRAEALAEREEPH